MTANRAAARGVLLLLLTATPSFAAPPTLDFFFPAGAQRGTSADVMASGKFDRWPVNFWTDHKSIDIKAAKDSGKFFITVGEDVDPGLHWIRVHDHEGASIARPFFVGNLAEATEVEPNDDPLKPYALKQPGVTVNGRLEKPGEVDVFSLPLKKGDTLIASVEAFQKLRSPMDAVLQILSADGFVLEQNHDYHDLDPHIVFQVPADGIYLVRIFSFPAVPDSGIRLAGGVNFVYRLTLTTAGFAEYPFPLAVERANPGSVEIVGWNIPAELRKFAVPASADNDVKLFHPQLANPIFVRLEPHRTMLKTRATREQPQSITIPTTISGRLDKPGDVDVYQFDARKGQKLTCRIEARTLGFLLDPVLELSDADGKVLKQPKPAALKNDPSLDFPVTSDGKYLLSVRDLHNGAGLRHAYRLTVATPHADFALKVATDRFTLTAAKPLDIVVTIDRQAGFNQEIELQLDGLPKGVAAVPVVAAASAKTATLRLLASEKTSFSGPLRILGKPKNEDRSRRAEATIAELSRSTPDLWLTVAGTKP